MALPAPQPSPEVLRAQLPNATFSTTPPTTTTTQPQTVTRTVVVKKPTQQYRPGVYREQVVVRQQVQPRPRQQSGVYETVMGGIGGLGRAGYNIARDAQQAARNIVIRRQTQQQQPRQVVRTVTRVPGTGTGAGAMGAGLSPAVVAASANQLGAWWGGANRYVSERIAGFFPSDATIERTSNLFTVAALNPFAYSAIRVAEMAAAPVNKQIQKIAGVGVNVAYPTEFYREYYKGELTGLRDEPVTAVASFGIGLALGGTTRVASAAVRRIPTLARTAAKPVTVLGRTTTQGALISKGITYGLGGLYGADVTVRATEGLTTSDPKTIARNVGYISSTEIGPMLAGGVVGFKSPEIARAGVSFTKRAISVSANKLSSIIKPPTTSNIISGWHPSMPSLREGPGYFDIGPQIKRINRLHSQRFPSSMTTIEEGLLGRSFKGGRQIAASPQTPELPGDITSIGRARKPTTRLPDNPALKQFMETTWNPAKTSSAENLADINFFKRGDVYNLGAIYEPTQAKTIDVGTLLKQSSLRHTQRFPSSMTTIEEGLLGRSFKGGRQITESPTSFKQYIEFMNTEWQPPKPTGYEFELLTSKNIADINFFRNAGIATRGIKPSGKIGGHYEEFYGIEQYNKIMAQHQLRSNSLLNPRPAPKLRSLRIQDETAMLRPPRQRAAGYSATSFSRSVKPSYRRPSGFSVRLQKPIKFDSGTAIFEPSPEMAYGTMVAGGSKAIYNTVERMKPQKISENPFLNLNQQDNIISRNIMNVRLPTPDIGNEFIEAQKSSAGQWQAQLSRSLSGVMSVSLPKPEIETGIEVTPFSDITPILRSYSGSRIDQKSSQRQTEELIIVPRQIIPQQIIEEPRGLRQVFQDQTIITNSLLLTRNIFLPYTGFPGGGMGGGGGGAGGWSFRGAMDETWRLGDMFADPFGVGEYVLGPRRKRRTTTTRKRGRK